MKSFSLLSLMVLFCFAGSIHAQSTREFPLKNTRKLEISSSSSIYIHQSDSSKMVVSGDEKDFSLFQWHSDEYHTTINASNGLGNSPSYDIHLYVKDLKDVEINGGSDVYFVDEFRQDSITLNVSGSSNLSGQLSVGYLNLLASGASNVTLKGSAEYASVNASGSSDVVLVEMPAKKMDVTASGATDVYVDATEELSAYATGASDIHYKSEPAKFSGNTSGASDIGPMKNGDTIHYDHDREFYSISPENNKAPENSPQNSKRFAASWKDMFGGGKWHQSLVWMGIDLGIDGLIDHSNGFDFQPQGDYNFMEMNYIRNTHVRLNFFEWRFNLVKNVFNIVTGLGFDFQHYAFSQKIRFDEADDYPGQGYTTPVVGVPDTIHSINRSRLAVQYFNVPLFLNLRTKKTARHKQQFNFTFGVVGGIKTGSSSRIIYSENGRDVEEEKKDDFFLETFTATAMVRIKYSFFSIYASYQFTPMFRGQNPNLYPFSIGVTLLSW